MRIGIVYGRDLKVLEHTRQMILRHDAEGYRVVPTDIGRSCVRDPSAVPAARRRCGIHDSGRPRDQPRGS